ncbi:ABC transporter substrate binding protein [Anoxynatronum buryatiense]|uniref:ABC-type uncharacterized transport system, substrate-binding protein n=1 Tax=Anoxynatronum buryatiense TaxID=489973 RepID=A0AA46AJ91_9CLOT|nr:ABC transporter substrate binding protein [Anoxynatronum buryatiense]SMP58084.1 ABC-type uncharacterized transport system, substrate-binding protein [Anoxynatronum buryatiense]
MKKSKGIISLMIILLTSLLVLQAGAAGVGPAEMLTETGPPADFKGPPLRIGYAETDPFANFAGTFHGLLIGLQELGWIDINPEEIPFTEGQEDSLVMWQWVEANNGSPYVTFVQDAHYSLLDDDAAEALVNRVEQEQDLDLMIVMGTYFGRVMAAADHETPTLVFSTSNAVQAGIIESPHHSGKDHLWAHMDADRYKRQVAVFHDIFEFEKLGLVYEDSMEGRIYAALEDLELLKEERGFELVTRIVKEASGEEDRDRYHEELLQAYTELADEVDALYMTAGTRDNRELERLLTPLYQAGIPVFSQLGATEVRHGALLSLYRADFTGVGRFGADQIGHVLRGEKPGDLPQIYGDTPSIVLNMAVAERTGYQPPFEILLIADEIYQSTE